MGKKNKKQKLAAPRAAVAPLNYAPPVETLLGIGESWTHRKSWPDYSAYNLTSADVPELRRMATDNRLLFHSEINESWAPMHALRVLALLGAREAIPDAIQTFIETQHEDWVTEEFPRLFARFGAESLAPLTQLLVTRSGGANGDKWFPSAVSMCVATVAESHPQVRDEAIVTLRRELEKYRDNDPDFNAIVIGHLTELGDDASLPLIEAAFKADCVDETVEGDWNDIRVRWGLPAVSENPFSDIAAGIKPRADDFFWETGIDKTAPPADAADLLERARQGRSLPRPTQMELARKYRKLIDEDDK